MCQAATRMECPTAVIALLAPRRAQRRRWGRGARRGGGGAAARAEAAVLGGEVGVFGAGGGECGFGERGAQPFGAFAGAAGRRLPPEASLPGAHAGPRGQVAG